MSSTYAIRSIGSLLCWTSSLRVPSVSAYAGTPRSLPLSGRSGRRPPTPLVLAR